VTRSVANGRPRATSADLVFAGQRSVLLSLLFLGVYGGCNWITAQRTDVDLWYFGWERWMPFWAPMIVPYLSIDLFFIVAPFLCRDRGEVRTFARRIALAIAVAGVCFLLMPLRFAFERPAWTAGSASSFRLSAHSTARSTCFRRCTSPSPSFCSTPTRMLKNAS
jgi:hypothetical protein